MEDPPRQISEVVTLLATADSPDIQKATVEKFFTQDAGFSHPVCAVNREPGSRDRILGIYQWYRVLSPTITIDVQEVAYNREKNVLYLDITQKFHIRYSPLEPAPARLITKLTLQKHGELHYIALQEDFYHPEDFVALIIPPLRPVIGLTLRTASLISAINARVAQAFGIWKPTYPPTSKKKAY